MAKMSQGSDGSFVSFLTAMAVCLLYLLACFLPCVDCGPTIPIGEDQFPDIDKGQIAGLGILLFGWGGGNNGVPWSANVFFAFGIACLWSKWFHAALWSGILATLLGLTTWWVRRYDTLMIGYYLWQASLLALAVGAAFAIRQSARKPVPTPLTGAQKQDLLRRLTDYEADRRTGSTREEVEARLQERE